MPYILLASILLALSAPALARASTYQWRDNQGVTHFTDNPDSIPAAYLSRAKELPSVKTERKIKAPSEAPASPEPASAVTAGAADVTRDKEQARLTQELKTLQERLAVKKKELARLHHKWSVAKGRTPSEKEIEEFEEKRAQGKATYKDNPYVNKNALSSPVPARVAYFKKLEEVRKDEERIRQLEQELQRLGK